MEANGARRLIAVDLDGTLVHARGPVHPRAVQAAANETLAATAETGDAVAEAIARWLHAGSSR